MLPLAGDRPVRGVEFAVILFALSDPSLDKALGVYGGVAFLRSGAPPSVSFAFSKHESKLEWAEKAAQVGVFSDDAEAESGLVGFEM